MAYFYAVELTETEAGNHKYLRAFTTKASRDGFVADGNRSFAKTVAEANDFARDNLCRPDGWPFKSAREAVLAGRV